MEQREGVRVRFRRGVLEDRVGHPTGVGDGEVAPYQGLTSCAFAPVRGGVGDGAINEGCNVGSNSAAVFESKGMDGVVAEVCSKAPVTGLVPLAANRGMIRGEGGGLHKILE